MDILKGNYDVVIVGSGIGGATTARCLVEKGLNVLILERGKTLKREAKNWSVETVFKDKHYTSTELWTNKEGNKFRANAYYNVGGASKFFGATMMRLREDDFKELTFPDGISPAWPIKYQDLAPYYDIAETMYGVRGETGIDINEPSRSTNYAFKSIPSEDQIAKVCQRLQNNGLAPFDIPLAVHRGDGGACTMCKTCDGFMCKVDGKGDAEICMILPAKKTGRLQVLENMYVSKINLSADTKKVANIEYVDEQGAVNFISAKVIVVACSAVNSAALLLKSTTADMPQGIANSSGLVGCHYMTHNTTAVMALSGAKNNTVFQKTVAINDYYFGTPDYPYPMGNIQTLGKVQSGMIKSQHPMIPNFIANAMSERSVDWFLQSEDLPDKRNRVTLQPNGEIKLTRIRNNIAVHNRLITDFKKVLKKSGFPIVINKTLGLDVTSHQCGTLRFGNDPKTSVLNQYCRSHDHENLFVIDSSFFPSSAAVNPALTIAAQAIRAAEHIYKTEFK